MKIMGQGVASILVILATILLLYLVFSAVYSAANRKGLAVAEVERFCLKRGILLSDYDGPVEGDGFYEWHLRSSVKPTSTTVTVIGVHVDWLGGVENYFDSPGTVYHKSANVDTHELARPPAPAGR